MADPVLCSAPNCNHNFGPATGAALNTLIELHARTAHPPPPAFGHPNVKAEKLKRPTIAARGTNEEFNYFESRWREYKAATNIQGAELVYQLLETCDDVLRKDITRCYGSLVGETEENVLRYIKTLAVRPENRMVSRVNLLNLRQKKDEQTGELEPLRSFVARLRGQAGVCNFVITKHCQCGQDITADYSDELIRDALVNGIHDEDIKLHIMGQPNQDMTLEETLQLAEAQECGKRSTGRLNPQPEHHVTANATSSYRRRNNQQRIKTQSSQNFQRSFQRNTQNSQQHSPSQSRTGSATCSHCGERGHGDGGSYSRRMRSCPAFNHQCTKCGNPCHFDNMCRSSQRQQQRSVPAVNQNAVFEEFNNSGFFDESNLLPDQICSTSDD